MFRHLQLSRPLAVIDLETTGLDPQTDRIVELSVLKVTPEGEVAQRTRRLNPTVPIPPESTAVHGITDADVQTEPTFAGIARGLTQFLTGCDLAGFNLKRFDLRMLTAEFARAGVLWDLDGRAVVDAMDVYHAREPRNLPAAVRFYLGREHEAAHAAKADAAVTAEVLDAMLGRYADLPRDVVGLQKHLAGPDTVDSDGFFTTVGGEVRFKKGKHRGQPLAFVARESPDYLRWMIGQTFFDDTKAVVRAALGDPVPSA